MKKKQANICISFSNIESMLLGLEQLSKTDIQILNIYSPLPVPAIHKYLKAGKTRLSQMAILGAGIGIVLAFFMQRYVMTVGYPLQLGGNPINSIVPYFPVLFECMVLGAGVAMFLTFILESKLGVRSTKKIIHNKVSDSVFVVECHSKKVPASSRECMFIDFGDDINLNQVIDEEEI